MAAWLRSSLVAVATFHFDSRPREHRVSPQQFPLLNTKPGGAAPIKTLQRTCNASGGRIGHMSTDDSELVAADEDGGEGAQTQLLADLGLIRNVSSGDNRSVLIRSCCFIQAMWRRMRRRYHRRASVRAAVASRATRRTVAPAALWVGGWGRAFATSPAALAPTAHTLRRITTGLWSGGA